MTSARTDYAGYRMDLRESRIRKLLRLLEDETPGRLLDVGCAGGELAALLATRGWRVQGAEAEPALVEAARARGVEARSVDLDRAPLPWPAGAFDAVVAAEVLEHVVDTNHLLAEIARVLRPGGALVVTPRTSRAWRTACACCSAAIRCGWTSASRAPATCATTRRACCATSSRGTGCASSATWATGSRSCRSACSTTGARRGWPSPATGGRRWPWGSS